MLLHVDVGAEVLGQGGQGELVDPAGGHRQVPVNQKRLHRRTEAHAGSVREAGEGGHLSARGIAHRGGATFTTPHQGQAATGALPRHQGRGG